MKILILTFIFQLILNAVELSQYINKNNCNQIIDKSVFLICYDYYNKGAKYVFYNLKGKEVNKNNIKKREDFYSENLIPIKYRTKSSDYINSGYDRGHLASDASFDYDEK